MELRNLAFRRYWGGNCNDYWTDVFEALWLFQSIDKISFPIPDVRQYLILRSSNHRLRVHMQPLAKPMLTINHLVKAVWKFIKTMCEFILTAKSIHLNGDGDNEFWVQCPPITRNVTCFLPAFWTIFPECKSFKRT